MAAQPGRVLLGGGRDRSDDQDLFDFDGCQ